MKEGMEVGQREENKQGWGVLTKGEWRGDTSAGVRGGWGGWGWWKGISQGWDEAGSKA